MNYLICQDWSNTTNNHAGMKYMCHLLERTFPHDFQTIVIPDLYKKIETKSIIGKVRNIIIRNFLVKKYLKDRANLLSSKLKEGDKIYLLEYCEKLYPQVIIAKALRKKHSDKIQILGLVHLVPEQIGLRFKQDELVYWIDSVDTVLTLGSSLSSFFMSTFGLAESKVQTLFHYVDLDYYKPSSKRLLGEYQDTEPSVLIMGNQKRNFDLIKQIVLQNKNIRFIICQGVLNLQEFFSECENVDLKGFLDEDELLELMQNSDISLNVMDDTIGSNVITTSMAVGMALIVSDVGSIRDYCKDDGAVYCNNSDITSFITAIQNLIDNKEELRRLQAKSIEYSKTLSIIKLGEILK